MTKMKVIDFNTVDIIEEDSGEHNESETYRENFKLDFDSIDKEISTVVDWISKNKEVKSKKRKKIVTLEHYRAKISSRESNKRFC